MLQVCFLGLFFEMNEVFTLHGFIRAVGKVLGRGMERQMMTRGYKTEIRVM